MKNVSSKTEGVAALKSNWNYFIHSHNSSSESKELTFQKDKEQSNQQNGDQISIYGFQLSDYED